MGFTPTRPSTVRVCQFRHLRRCSSLHSAHAWLWSIIADGGGLSTRTLEVTPMEFSPLIDSADELERLLEHLVDEPVIAMDAEMDSFYSYFTKLCLVQISSSKGDFLLDPLADLDLSPLNEVTSNAEQVKDLPRRRERHPLF